MTGLPEKVPALPFAAPLLALAFWIAWITIAYSGDCIVVSHVSAYEATTTLRSLSTLGIGIAMVACACLPERGWNVVTDFNTMVGVAGASLVCTLAVGFQGVLPDILYGVCSFVAGVCLGVFALRCAVLYAEVSPRTAALYICMATLAGVMLYAFSTMIAHYHSPIWVQAMTAPLLLGGVAVSFVRTEGDECVPLHDDASLTLSSSFWRVIAFVAIIAFALSTVRGFYPQFLEPEQFASSRGDAALLIVVFATAFLIDATRRKPSDPFVRQLYGMLLVSVAIMLPVAFLGISSGLVGSLATFSKAILLVSGWCFLSLWSYKTGMSAVRVFGFGFGVAMVAAFVGYMFGDNMGLTFIRFDAPGLQTVFLVVCIVAAVLLLSVRDLGDLLEPTAAMMASAEGGESDEAQSTQEEGTPQAVRSAEVADAQADGIAADDGDAAAEQPDGTRKAGRFLLKCKLISDEFGLSPREADVLVLLAKHMPVKAIADELFVSFNTARTHVRHVYGKLDVHSRRELDELIDAYEID